LASLTAATHGLDEEAELLQQQLEEASQPVPAVNPSAVFLQPPPPIAQAKSNWHIVDVNSLVFRVCKHSVLFYSVTVFYLFLQQPLSKLKLSLLECLI
jgi:hypothetical protein